MNFAANIHLLVKNQYLRNLQKKQHVSLMNIFLSILYVLLIAGILLTIIFDNGDSGKKIAWILVVSVLPVAGIVLYLMFGISYRQHWLFRRRYKVALETFDREKDAKLERLLRLKPDYGLIDERFRPLPRLFTDGMDSFPFSKGNSFEIITDGKRKLSLLLNDMENARESIHVEYFHFGADEGSNAIRDMMTKKAKEGVEVRFINENIANLPIPAVYYDRMKRSGVEVRRFTNPTIGLVNFATKLNYRDHRKIVVIDGRIAYTGGMNINNHYFFQWRDTHLRIEGNAAASLQASFLSSWLTSGGKLKRPLPDYFHEFTEGETIIGGPNTFTDKMMQVVADTPDAPWPMIQMGYELVLQNVRDYIFIQSPYFVPPTSFLNALKAAALRGVDVRLMLPQKVDTPLLGYANRSFYRECLEAGIRIYERGGEFIHSKTFVCDDYLSQIGTANIDIRSFDIDYEINTYIYDRETALRMKEIFEKDLDISKEITLDEWRQRKWYQTVFPRIVRLFSGLL